MRKHLISTLIITALIFVLTGCSSNEIIGEVYGPEHEYIKIGDDTYTVCYDSGYSASDKDKRLGKLQFTNIDTDLMTVYSVKDVDDNEYIYTIWGYDGAFYKRDSLEATTEMSETEEISDTASDSLEERDAESGEVDMKKYYGENFIFYKVEDEERTGSGYHNIRGVYEEYYQADYHGLFVGQVVTLFGSENVNSDNEDLLSYSIAAEDNNGDIIYLEVYYGPSGPAIGGLDGENYAKAAEELETLIRNTVPIDFEVTSVYGDLDITTTMGTKNGVGYYETVFSEEMMDMYLNEYE